MYMCRDNVLPSNIYLLTHVDLGGREGGGGGERKGGIVCN